MSRTCCSQREFAVLAGVPRPWAFNALNFSQLLTPEDLQHFSFGGEGLHWKLLAAGALRPGVLQRLQ